MGTIFEDKTGYVVKASNDSATKALLRVNGAMYNLHTPSVETIFVTSLQVQHGVNHSVSYALDNHIFLSVAGDRLGSLKLQGMVFSAVCGDKVVVSNLAGGGHSGLVQLSDFYKTQRLIGGQKDVPQIEVFYDQAENTLKYTGYVAAMSSQTADVCNGSLNFTLDCLLIP